MTNWEKLVKEGASESELLPSIHPGEVLKVEFLDEYGMSQNQLAIATGMTPQRVGQIVLGKRSVTADAALRLACFFDTSPEFWLNLQAQYDLEVAAREHGGEIVRRVPLNIQEWLCMPPESRSARIQELCEDPRISGGWKVAAKSVAEPRGKRVSSIKND